MCLWIILSSILINKKARHLGKSKIAQPGNVKRKLHTSEYTKSCAKKISIVLYCNKGTIDYNQQCHSLHLGNKQYKQFPQHRNSLKKRKRKKEKERGKERKRECERKGKRDGNKREIEKKRKRE